ncbi:MAG: hypothetical protein V1820_04810 [archaeon]
MDSKRYQELENFFGRARDDYLFLMQGVFEEFPEEKIQAISETRLRLEIAPEISVPTALAAGVLGSVGTIDAAEAFKQALLFDFLAGETEAAREGKSSLSSGITEEEFDGLYAIYPENYSLMNPNTVAKPNPESPIGACLVCFFQTLDTIRQAVFNSTLYPAEVSQTYNYLAERTRPLALELAGEVVSAARKENAGALYGFRETAEKFIGNLIDGAEPALRALGKAAAVSGEASLLDAYDAFAPQYLAPAKGEVL